MRKIALFLAVVGVLTFVASCGEKKKPTIIGEQPEMTFTHEDSAEIKSLINEFIVRLDSNDIQGATEMIQFLNGDSIIPMSPILARRQAMTLANVRGVKWEMKYIILRNLKNNEIKMDITLFDKPEGDPKPNKTSFFFRPVKFEGRWYLTTKDNITDTNSQERNEN
jgi:hypothetical protein